MTTETCPGCGGSVVRIALDADGRPLEMHSCRHCDRRWWTSDGLPADPTELLARRRVDVAA